MIYKKYGTIFKKLREQQNFPLSSFSPIGISKATLSNFERGESMMSFDKVVTALQYMGVSLEEFELFLNDYSQNDSDFFMDEIEKANIAQDTEKLIKLSNEAKKEGFPYISLAAKAAWTNLTKPEIEDLTNRFNEIELWSYKELCILFLTTDHLKTSDIIKIFKEFLDNENLLFNSPKYRSYLVQACCRGVSTLSYRGQKEEAKYILNQIEYYNLPNSMYLRNLVNITKGYWIYCFENPSKGNSMMLQSLQFFYEVSTPKIFQYYQDRYNRLVLSK